MLAKQVIDLEIEKAKLLGKTKTSVCLVGFAGTQDTFRVIEVLRRLKYVVTRNGEILHIEWNNVRQNRKTA